eukprot:52491-Pelagomonas_calceolata.AAC.1
MRMICKATQFFLFCFLSCQEPGYGVSMLSNCNLYTEGWYQGRFKFNLTFLKRETTRQSLWDSGAFSLESGCPIVLFLV